MGPTSFWVRRAQPPRLRSMYGGKIGCQLITSEIDTHLALSPFDHACWASKSHVGLSEQAGKARQSPTLSAIPHLKMQFVATRSIVSAALCDGPTLQRSRSTCGCEVVRCVQAQMDITVVNFCAMLFQAISVQHQRSGISWRDIDPS